MPELEIQRRQGIPAWVWVLGALVLIGLIWWIIAATTDDRNLAAVPPDERVAGERMDTPAATPGATDLTSSEWLPLAAMRANPDNYFGQTITGVGTVAEVVSDRAFWIEQRGSRVFVVKDDPLVSAPALTAGEEVQFTGIARDPQYMQQVPGVMKLDSATQRMLQGEPVFFEATSIQPHADAGQSPGS